MQPGIPWSALPEGLPLRVAGDGLAELMRQALLAVSLSRRSQSHHSGRGRGSILTIHRQIEKNRHAGQSGGGPPKLRQIEKGMIGSAPSEWLHPRLWGRDHRPAFDRMVVAFRGEASMPADHRLAA